MRQPTRKGTWLVPPDTFRALLEGELPERILPHVDQQRDQRSSHLRLVWSCAWQDASDDAANRRKDKRLLRTRHEERKRWKEYLREV